MASFTEVRRCRCSGVRVRTDLAKLFVHAFRTKCESRTCEL